LKTIRSLCVIVPTILLFVLIAVPTVKADPIDLSLLVGQTVSLTVEPYSSGENDGQDYVGLTQLLINGQPLWGFCADYGDNISVPSTYPVKVVGLMPWEFTGDSLGLSLDQLRQQAALGLNFGSSPSGDLQADIAAQHLIWNYTGGQFTSTSEMAMMDMEMFATYAGRDYSNSFFLDPLGGGQGFDPVDLPTAPTPEPASFFLFGSGLGLFSFLAASRHKKVGAIEISLQRDRSFGLAVTPLWGDHFFIPKTERLCYAAIGRS